MKQTTDILYEAEDGRTFADPEECAAHEERLRQEAAITSYWAVTHTPDLTEGRGWYGLLLVKCVGPAQAHAKLLMEDWCYRTYGSPLAHVMGAYPYRNWSLMKIDASQYEAQDEHTSVGDRSYPGKRIRLKGDQSLSEH